MVRTKFHVKKGDQVTVISGNHKGGAGKILAVLPKKQQVLVEGVRIIKRHVRKSQESPQGAILEREGPLHVSNVKLLKTELSGKKADANISPKKSP